MNDIPIFYFLCRYDEAIGNVYDDILRKKNFNVLIVCIVSIYLIKNKQHVKYFSFLFVGSWLICATTLM